MKPIKVSKGIAFLFSLMVALPNFAQDNGKRVIRGEPIDYKCFVEYSGGNGYDVRFIIGHFSNARQAGKKLNRSIVEKGQNKAIRVIHKVHECVKEDQSFKSSKARRLDEVTPR